MASSVVDATTLPVSRMLSEYSLRVIPRSMARCRSLMLCALEPVKYRMAAPKCSGATTRRSICMPAAVNTEVFLSPRAITSVTIGMAAKNAMIG